MNTPSAPPSDEPCASVRIDIRLDPTTRQKVDDLAQHCHQPRAAVLCHIRKWGLSCGQPETLDYGTSQGQVCHLDLYVEADLHRRVEKAAAAAGAKTAPWLRHMVRQNMITDFLASRQQE
jgi:hypothetical protein